MRHGVAKLVRLRFFVDHLPRPALVGLVPTRPILSRHVEQFFQCLRFHAPHAFGRHLELALGVLLHQPPLNQLVEQFRALLFEFLEQLQRVVAVLQEVVADLVEHLVGRLRRKWLRTIPFGIFKARHDGVCPDRETGLGASPTL